MGTSEVRTCFSLCELSVTVRLQFADLCLQLSREANPVTGARIVYNLDGGNSSSLVFKTRDNGGRLSYAKLNMPKLSRPLADMICFVTLEALNDEPAE